MRWSALLLLAGHAAALVAPRAPRAAPRSRVVTMSVDELKQSNQQFAAGALGAVVGTFYGGPLAGVLLSAGFNQGAKAEGEVGRLFLSAGEVAIKARTVRASQGYAEAEALSRSLSGVEWRRRICVRGARAAAP